MMATFFRTTSVTSTSISLGGASSEIQVNIIINVQFS